MNNLGSDTNSDINIQNFSSLNITEKKAFIKNTNDPKKLIAIFQEYNPNEEVAVTKKLLKKIEKLESTLNPDQIKIITKKIISINES
ncbi:MAG TPA: hypothetical protein VGP47_11615, partial [Parachlamydiaceae bacterium]|nr:hypothetical protein [Parachlamydiaceae bacterium]